jgi:hypothetical protein
VGVRLTQSKDEGEAEKTVRRNVVITSEMSRPPAQQPDANKIAPFPRVEKEYHLSESRDLQKSLQGYHAAQNKVMSHRVDRQMQKVNGQRRTRALAHSKTQNEKRIG